MDFVARDPDFAKRVRGSFEAQAFMRLIKLSIVSFKEKILTYLN